jgi:hypothetical protein
VKGNKDLVTGACCEGGVCCACACACVCVGVGVCGCVWVCGACVGL